MAEEIFLPIRCLVAQRHAFYLIYFHDLAKIQNNKGWKNNLPKNLVWVFQEWWPEVSHWNFFQIIILQKQVNLSHIAKFPF